MRPVLAAAVGEGGDKIHVTEFGGFDGVPGLG
jgi:hypothetical protein